MCSNMSVLERDDINRLKNIKKEDLVMKKRKIQHGKVKFPRFWIEMNPKYAKKSKNVVICVDGFRVGVYYTENKVEDLTIKEMVEIATYAYGLGFDEDYRIYGLIEQSVADNTLITNVGNVELVREQ